MGSYKSIFTSTTFWGIVISSLASSFPIQVASVMSFVGVTDQTMLAAKVIALLGALIALYGRWTATKIVTLTGQPPAFKP